MIRWDIINHFIKKNNYKSFLEIGYYKGWNFDSVNCDNKTTVDPNPCKTPDQEELEYGNSMQLSGISYESLYKMTSDEFFSKEAKGSKWDIVFIDGLHEAKQVTRDIENSLKHLSDGGVIVLHDCNPPTYEHTTTGDCGGNWNGDVYKAVYKASIEPQNDFYTVDTDWGVGVLKRREGMRVNGTAGRGRDLSWEEFDANRKEILNLISVEEFLEKEKIDE